MNRITKKITVRFYSITTETKYFDDLISIYNANSANDNSVRITNIREKKYLLKIHTKTQHQNTNVLYLSVVRERNTWQARALADGTISGIPLNQGIIGDPYYFMIIPSQQMVLGFTTGLSNSLKSVATTTLQQFNKDRGTPLELEHISNQLEFSKLRELTNYSALHFKINTSSLGNTSEGLPRILEELNSAPFMPKNSQIALTAEIGDEGFSEQDLIEIVDYLAEDEGCSALIVQGMDSNGNKVRLNFSNAFYFFRKPIEIRNKFVDEIIANNVLREAIDYFWNATSINS